MWWPIESKFSQVCYFMQMLEYTKWEDCSLTITNQTDALGSFHGARVSSNTCASPMPFCTTLPRAPSIWAHACQTLFAGCLVAQWVVIGQYAMGQSLLDRSTVPIAVKLSGHVFSHFSWAVSRWMSGGCLAYPPTSSITSTSQFVLHIYFVSLLLELFCHLVANFEFVELSLIYLFDMNSAQEVL